MRRRPRSKAVSRDQAPKIDESTEYLFAIESLAPSYTFGAGSNFQATVHDEHLNAHILARCLAPAKFAGRLTTFNLLGDRANTRQQMEPSAQFKAAVVGLLTFRGRHSDYLGGMPFDALLHLLPLVDAQRIKFISLTGAAAYRGAAEIARISFSSDLAEADITPQ